MKPRSSQNEHALLWMQNSSHTEGCFFKSTGQDVKPAAEDIQQAVMARVLLYCWKPATGIA